MDNCQEKKGSWCNYVDIWDFFRYYADMSEDEYLTADQVAGKLQLHARTVRRLLVSGVLPGKKIGGKEWRVSAAALKAYIEGGEKPGKRPE